MTEHEYATKSQKEVIFHMLAQSEERLKDMISIHYDDIRSLMNKYHKLILENRKVLMELEYECMEKINLDMAYALQYIDIYRRRVNTFKMNREMHNLMMIYSLTSLIRKGITLVKYYAPHGDELSKIIEYCFCSRSDMSDTEIFQELGLGKTHFYKVKKEALGYLGFFFYEIVVPQAKDSLGMPSLGVS
jgi:hypothetical protein